MTEGLGILLSPNIVQSVIEPLALFVAGLIIAFALLQNGIYVLQIGLAYSMLKKRPTIKTPLKKWQTMSDTAKPISVLVPAYNEEITIVENIRSMLSLHYPNFEVIIINDGSLDNTLDVVVQSFGLEPVERAYDLQIEHQPILGLYGSSQYPNLILLDKVNGGGKADAINAGINLSRYPLFCAIDADSLLEGDALLRAVQPFEEDPDRVIAVGGAVRLVNGCTVKSGRVTDVGIPKNPLALFQVVEYLRAFLMARLAWSRINTVMLISGAFGIFKRSTVIEVGGYSNDTVGEDLEIIIKLHRHMREQKRDYSITFVPDPVCWTEAPETLKILGNQRGRWQRGALESFFKHIRMTFNPRYGSVGLIGFPYILLVDVLGPVVEIFGYMMMPLLTALGLLDLAYMFAYLGLTFIFGVAISVGALVLEEMEFRRFPNPVHLIILTLVAVVENFGYRQLNTIWRCAGYWQFVRRKPHKWGVMTRRGFRTR